MGVGMALPDEYRWLESVGVLPRTIQEALPLLGVQEVVGRGSNKTIIGWRDELNQDGIQISGYSDDDIPWCGLMAAIVAHRADKEVPAMPLWARNWAKFGEPVAERRGGKLIYLDGKVPSLGDCMVYERPGGGGHVEWYIAETKTAFIGIGGNKSNAVRIGGIAKARCIAVRRPVMKNPPASVRPYFVTTAGALTQNEA